MRGLQRALQLGRKGEGGMMELDREVWSRPDAQDRGREPIDEGVGRAAGIREVNQQRVQRRRQG